MKFHENWSKNLLHQGFLLLFRSRDVEILNKSPNFIKGRDKIELLEGGSRKPLYLEGVAKKGGGLE